MLRFATVCAAVLIVGLAPSSLQAAQAVPAAALQECGGCHNLYPPQYLPQRSWAALLARLDDHFGEIATLPADELAAISTYLAANASDGPQTKGGSRFLRDVRPDETPLRITDLPWWQDVHGWVNFNGIEATKVRSASNCAGCHEDGEW